MAELEFKSHLSPGAHFVFIVLNHDPVPADPASGKLYGVGWHLDKEESILPCSQEISEQEATTTISEWESRKGTSQGLKHPQAGGTFV